MSKIAALNVQTASRPATVRPAASVVARADDGGKGVPTPAQPAATAKDLAPAATVVAPAALAVLIQVQAQGEDAASKAHVDPQPAHGEDDDHGHKPPASDPPPVVQPSAPFDPALPARTIAMINHQLADEAISQRARSTFEAAAAARHAERTIVQGQAALAILQTVQADMTSFRSDASTRAGWGRRGLYA